MFGGQSKNVGKLGALACAVAAAGVFLGTTRTAAADSINIIINTSGAPAYYQINNGTWETISASPVNWDSMSSTPTGSTQTRNTDYFPVNNLNDGVYEVNPLATPIWRAGPTDSSNTTQGALILTQGGTAAGSSVSNLLVLDGQGGIYLYNAPTLTAGATNTSSPVNTYGYTGNNTTTHYDPGLGTPITELGGLQSDLEYNPGMAGNGDGTNIVAGAQQLITDPRTHLTVEGYAFTSPTELRLQSDSDPTVYSYVTPTIYVETVPLPAAAWSGLSLLVGLGGFFAVSKRFRRVPRIA